MNIFKIFIVFLALVKINDSQTHKYCKHSLFNTKGINIGSVSGERFSIPIDYKRHTIEVVNNARNELNTPMNYVNWDNELDKVAINLLTKILTYSHCAIEESKKFPCLVSTPVRKDLYVAIDQARFNRTTNKETFFKKYKLTNSDFFHLIANTTQNITSVGCSILRIPASCYAEPLKDIMSMLCLFSGIKGTLLPNKTDNWTNLYGPNYPIVDMTYTKVEDLFDINENDIYFFLYGLNILIYALIIMCYVFLKCMKSFHIKILLADDIYDHECD